MAQSTASAAPRGNKRGEGATGPTKFPARGWRDILLRVFNNMGADNIAINAAGVAFFALLALFPALAATLGLYGLIAEPQQIQEQIASLSSVLPGEARQLLTTQLEGIASAAGGSLSLGVVVGLLVAIWSASKGMGALMSALNVAYHEDESRGFIKTKLAALLLTFCAALFVIVTLTLIVAVPALLGSFGLPEAARVGLRAGRWVLLGVAMVAGLAAIYRYAPSRRNARWQWVAWGALIATIIWLIGSVLFSFYVSHFGSYNKTYGSIGAVIILMLWFNLSAYAVLIGAEVNAEMEHQTGVDTTVGQERSAGERQAVMADTLGEKP